MALSSAKAVEQIETFKRLFLNYYAAKSEGAPELEWEMRFQSWRPFTGTPPRADLPFPWDPKLTYDEFVNVPVVMKSYGWKLLNGGEAVKLKRCLMKNSGVRAEHGGIAPPRWVEKTEYVSRFDQGIHALLHSLHVKTALQTEKERPDLGDVLSGITRARRAGNCIERSITRTTLVHPKYPFMRIDCSQVESAGYEIELEIIPSSEVDAGVILRAILAIIGAIQKTKWPIEGARWLELTEWTQSRIGAMKIPQPVSIRPEHLSQIIGGKFSVTDKADGERCFLILHRQSIFRVDNACRIINMGCRLKEGEAVDNFVVDGEYLAETDEFLAFDLMSMDGTLLPAPVTFYTHELRERLTALNMLFEYLGATTGSTKWRVKEFFFPLGLDAASNVPFFEHIEKLLKNANDNPHSDGMIFTALDVPRLGRPEYNPVTVTRWPSVRWEGALKWKTPEQTTIDFQLGQFEIVGAGGAIRSSLHVAGHRGALILFEGSGYGGTTTVHSWVEFPWKGAIGGAAPPKSLVVDHFYLKEGMVVECSFRAGRWIVTRPRPDKRFPNAVDVAYANWDLIIQPVIPPTSLLSAEEMMTKWKSGYYELSSSSDPFTANMRNFHNNVKRQSYIRASEILRAGGAEYGGSLTILDTAIGRGGDLLKYSDLGVTSVVFGLDIDGSNLDTCRTRFHQLKRTRPAMYNLILFEADSSISLEKQSTWQATAKLKFASPGTSPAPLQQWLFRRSQFDIVSHQFALHFFWSEEQKVDDYIANVAGALRKGGIFIASCYDGTAVASYFQEHAELCLASDTGEPYFRVKPLYRREKHFHSGDCWGFGIEVFNLSANTQHAYTEWLVHPQVFTQKMERAGFRALSAQEFFDAADTRFSTLFSKLSPPNSAPPSDAQMRTICGWNRLFIFQRLHSDPCPSSSSFSSTSLHHHGPSLMLLPNVKVSQQLKFCNTLSIRPSTFIGKVIPMHAIHLT